MTSMTRKEERRAERLLTPLPVRVETHEPQHKVWREVTHLKSVSDIGAGFYLNRFFEIGQLLLLAIPLEKKLRRYDRDAQEYCVWGIVRHCYKTSVGKSSVYHIGVAFTGKEPPPSYLKNPGTIYKFIEIKKDGFWQISEDDKPPSTRKQPRYMMPVGVFIGICDAEENIIKHEKTIAENISESGASVFSSLELKVGDKVKFIKDGGGFAAMAIVRNRRVGKDNIPRVHLEFIAARFPLEELGGS